MDEQKKQTERRHPWLWVPTLYFTQGMPYTVVMEMANVFFTAMKVPLEAIGIFSGLFNLPWAFKFVWSPLVELVGSKRGWIRVVQGLLALMLIALAFVIASPISKHMISSKIYMPNLSDSFANASFTIGLLALLFSLAMSLDVRRKKSVRVVSIAVCVAVIAYFAAFHGRIFAAQQLSISSTIWVIFAVFLGIAVFSATQDIAIDGFYLDALDKDQQAAYSGVRVMFYRVAMIVGSGVLLMLVDGEALPASLGFHGIGWPKAVGIGAVIFGCLYLFHALYLPKAQASGPAIGDDKKSYARAFTTFLDQKGIVLILLFIVLFRIDDALWKPISKPFLMAIGVTVGNIGLLQGVFGVAATILGGIVGGIYVAKRGLIRSLWVLGIAHSLNQFLYAYLALIHPVLPEGKTLDTIGLVHVGIVNALENFCIGLGTIAFVNFLMRICRKDYSAAHYAICTGLMALSGMLAGFLSGFIAKKIGFMHYFIFCWVSSLPGLLVLYFLPLKDIEGGRD